MEQVENKAMIEVCLSCPRRTCHPVHCARYEAALRKLGPGVTRKRKLYFAWGRVELHNGMGARVRHQ